MDVTGPVGHRAACVVKGCLGYCDSSTHATIYSRNMGNTPVAQAIYAGTLDIIYRVNLQVNFIADSSSIHKVVSRSVSKHVRDFHFHLLVRMKVAFFCWKGGSITGC